MYVLKVQLGRTWYAWSKGLPGTMATVQERKHVHNNDTPKKPDNGWQLVVWAEGTRDRAVRGTPTCSKPARMSGYLRPRSRLLRKDGPAHQAFAKRLSQRP